MNMIYSENYCKMVPSFQKVHQVLTYVPLEPTISLSVKYFIETQRKDIYKQRLQLQYHIITGCGLGGQGAGELAVLSSPLNLEKII